MTFQRHSLIHAVLTAGDGEVDKGTFKDGWRHQLGDEEKDHLLTAKVLEYVSETQISKQVGELVLIKAVHQVSSGSV